MTPRPQYKPKRHIRHEVYSLLAVLAAPVVLAFVFPYSAIGFRSEAPKSAARPTCSFVTLSPDETDAAIAAARAAIKTSSTAIGRIRADLSLSAIPEEASIAVADISERHTVAPVGTIEYRAMLLPPTMAAPRPERIKAAAPPAPQPAFSRSTLIELLPSLPQEKP